MESTLQPRELGRPLPLIIGLTGVQAVACGAWAQIPARARGHPTIKWFCIGFFLSAAGFIWADTLPSWSARKTMQSGLHLLATVRPGEWMP